MLSGVKIKLDQIILIKKIRRSRVSAMPLVSTEYGIKADIIYDLGNRG